MQGRYERHRQLLEDDRARRCSQEPPRIRPPERLRGRRRKPHRPHHRECDVLAPPSALRSVRRPILMKRADRTEPALRHLPREDRRREHPERAETDQEPIDCQDKYLLGVGCAATEPLLSHQERRIGCQGAQAAHRLALPESGARTPNPPPNAQEVALSQPEFLNRSGRVQGTGRSLRWQTSKASPLWTQTSRCSLKTGLQRHSLLEAPTIECEEPLAQ
jgi:hypothetical protein